MFTLFEELFMLAIHEEKGTLLSSVSQNLAFGLNGALLAELSLQGKILVNEDHRLELVDPTPTGDEILDAAIGEIQSEEHKRKVGYWIRTLSEKPKKVREHLVERLAAKGVFKQEEEHLSWVIPFAEYPEIHASAKYSLKKHLREQILECCGAPLRELALLALADTCGMLELVFVRDERKIAKRCVYEQIMRSALAEQASLSVQEIDSALGSLVEED